MGLYFRLVLQTAPASGQEFPLSKDEIFIGREMYNDILINGPEVSRRHSHLVRRGDVFYIEDAGSTNGTAVNGRRIRSFQALKHGDIVTLGERIHLVFEQASSPEQFGQSAPAAPQMIPMVTAPLSPYSAPPAPQAYPPQPANPLAPQPAYPPAPQGYPSAPQGFTPQPGYPSAPQGFAPPPPVVPTTPAAIGPYPSESIVGVIGFVVRAQGVFGLRQTVYHLVVTTGRLIFAHQTNEMQGVDAQRYGQQAKAGGSGLFGQIKAQIGSRDGSKYLQAPIDWIVGEQPGNFWVPFQNIRTVRVKAVFDEESSPTERLQIETVTERLEFQLGLNNGEDAKRLLRQVLGPVVK